MTELALVHTFNNWNLVITGDDEQGEVLRVAITDPELIKSYHTEYINTEYSQERNAERLHEIAGNIAEAMEIDAIYWGEDSEDFWVDVEFDEEIVLAIPGVFGPDDTDTEDVNPLGTDYLSETEAEMIREFRASQPEDLA